MLTPGMVDRQQSSQEETAAGTEEPVRRMWSTPMEVRRDNSGIAGEVDEQRYIHE